MSSKDSLDDFKRERRLKLRTDLSEEERQAAERIIDRFTGTQVYEVSISEHIIL
jgi:hypothetical protein